MLDRLPAGLPGPALGLFAGRTGGVSEAPWSSLNLGLHVDDEVRRVLANRTLLCDEVGLHLDDFVFAEQVHGCEVAVVDRASREGPDGGRGVPGVDALVTATPGIGLAVLAADCLPVLLADPQAGVVGAAHAGRQGLVAGVLQATVEAMTGLGADPGRISATLGPAACGGCYELPAALADEVAWSVPGSRSTTRQATASIDLVAGARAILTRAGLSGVQQVGGCTIEQPAQWFSYRRDGRTGRHAGLVWLAP